MFYLVHGLRWTDEECFTHDSVLNVHNTQVCDPSNPHANASAGMVYGEIVLDPICNLPGYLLKVVVILRILFCWVGRICALAVAQNFWYGTLCEMCPTVVESGSWF